MPREKSPVTTGIDPGILRLVAQCLNHYATPGPNKKYVISDIMTLNIPNYFPIPTPYFLF
jgi:hypothetical protein